MRLIELCPKQIKSAIPNNVSMRSNMSDIEWVCMTFGGHGKMLILLHVGVAMPRLSANSASLHSPHNSGSAQ